MNFYTVYTVGGFAQTGQEIWAKPYVFIDFFVNVLLIFTPFTLFTLQGT